MTSPGHAGERSATSHASKKSGRRWITAQLHLSGWRCPASARRLRVHRIDPARFWAGPTARTAVPFAPSRRWAMMAKSAWRVPNVLGVIRVKPLAVGHRLTRSASVSGLGCALSQSFSQMLRHEVVTAITMVNSRGHQRHAMWPSACRGGALARL